MAQRVGRPSINAGVRERRKSTQRERLLEGVVAVANRDGYARASVSGVIAEAGVSRRTFYEYFADRNDCFLAALSEIHERLLGEVTRSIRGQERRHAIRAAIEAIVTFAARDTPAARFLMSESMAGGPRALDARDEGIAEVERAIERAYAEAEPTSAVADVSPRVMIGAVYRLLALRLRRGEPRLSALLGDLLAWSKGYERPLAEHRWRALEPSRRAPSPGSPSPSPMRAPPALPPGRPRLSEEQVAANHRQRILFAAAQLAERKGYTATTIAEITKLARVDGRAFYALFADKQDAFMAVHELGFQEVMAVTAGAFFAGPTWPERSWEAGRAFTQFLEQNPTFARVGFVEANAVGLGAIQRVEDSRVAFTIFLQEGYQHLGPRTPPSRLALEAIIAAIFEIAYLQTRAQAQPRMMGLLGHITFLSLAPFIGAEEANEFIGRRLTASGGRARAQARTPS